MATNFGMTGVETFILRLCSAQKRLGSFPQIYLDVEGRSELVENASAMQVPVHDLPKAIGGKQNGLGKFGTAITRARRIGTLRRLLRNADVLHIHSVGLSGFDSLVAAWAARSRAVVVTHHTTMGWAGPLSNRMNQTTFWLEKHIASHVVMPYSAAARELVEFGFPANKVSIVPFCTDDGMFTGSVTLPVAGELSLVMAARLVAGKGHSELLQAMGKLRDQHPGIRLMLIGDGPERANIESDVKRRGLESCVRFYGQVAPGAIPSLLAQGHVIVLPSYMSGETFPLSLLEGMGLGLPAIGSRWFGIPDIIDDGRTGFLVEPRDADALATAIERMLSEPGLFAAMSRAARERVEERFTSMAVAREYEKIYANALFNLPSNKDLTPDLGDTSFVSGM